MIIFERHLYHRLKGADLLFQIISHRYEQGSLIITTNRVFKDWPEIFNNDSTLTSALLDRLLHHTETVVIERRLDQTNADDMVQGWDVVMDGMHNFAGRFTLNYACIRHGLPLVYGAVMRFQGQVSVFWPARSEAGPCLRCLLPEPPDRDATPSCAEAGVLG